MYQGGAGFPGARRAGPGGGGDGSHGCTRVGIRVSQVAVPLGAAPTQRTGIASHPGTQSAADQKMCLLENVLARMPAALGGQQNTLAYSEGSQKLTRWGVRRCTRLARLRPKKTQGCRGVGLRPLQLQFMTDTRGYHHDLSRTLPNHAAHSKNAIESAADWPGSEPLQTHVKRPSRANERAQISTSNTNRNDGRPVVLTRTAHGRVVVQTRSADSEPRRRQDFLKETWRGYTPSDEGTLVNGPKGYAR